MDRESRWLTAAVLVIAVGGIGVRVVHYYELLPTVVAVVVFCVLVAGVLLGLASTIARAEHRPLGEVLKRGLPGSKRWPSP